MSKKSNDELLELAAQAHTDLAMFDGIVALLESGSISPDSQADANRVIANCKTAIQKQLRRFDKARAALSATHGDSNADHR